MQRDAQFRHDDKAVFSPVLARIPGIRHASTTRAFTATLPSNTSRTDEMRAVCELIDLPDSFLAIGEQKHTANVAVVKQPEFMPKRHRTYPATDALVTDQPGVVLAIQTADCTPILLADTSAHVIGVVHAGWRGTYGRIAEKTIAQMIKLGANAQNIIAWIGPLACVCCYEVSAELIETFSREFPALSPDQIFEGRKLNLLNINVAQLKRVGLPSENIYESNICTIHQNDQFFSYRAEDGTCGRIISALGISES